MLFHFVTSSANKFAEAERVFPGLVRVEADLPEIQSLDSREIVRAKLAAACALGISNPVVEDTALELSCLGGLPGPFVKFFLKTLGAARIFEIAQTLGDLSVVASTTAALSTNHRPEAQEIIAVGRVEGILVPPAGGHGFGFDSIFRPLSSPCTYAELSEEQKATISHRSLAFQELRRRAQHAIRDQI